VYNGVMMLQSRFKYKSFLIIFFLLVYGFLYPVKAEQLPQTSIITASPSFGSVSGSNKGNSGSFQVTFDISQIPVQTTIESAKLMFDQNKTGSGLLKIINIKTGAVPDIFTLGSNGVRTSASLNDLIGAWITKPGDNSGLLFQAYELDNNDSIAFSNIRLEISYLALDTTQPQILGQQITEVSETHILLKWQSDEPTKGYLKYGKTINYGQQSDTTAILGLDNSIILINLTPGVTYHYMLFIEDEAGNKSKTEDNTFQTVIPNNAGNQDQSPSSTILFPKDFQVTVKKQNDTYQNVISWKMSSSSETNGYIIFKKIDTGKLEEYVTLDKNTIDFIDYKVELGHRYTYVIKAFNDQEISSPSPEQTVYLNPNGEILGIETDKKDKNNSGLYKTLLVFGILAFWLYVMYRFYKKIQLEFQHKKGLENVLKNPEYYESEYERNVTSNI
jgi:hypothetical protein